jgi:hypothetical protein
MAWDPDAAVAPPPQPGVNGIRYSEKTGYVYYTWLVNHSSRLRDHNDILNDQCPIDRVVLNHQIERQRTSACHGERQCSR